MLAKVAVTERVPLRHLDGKALTLQLIGHPPFSSSALNQTAARCRPGVTWVDLVFLGEVEPSSEWMDRCTGTPSHSQLVPIQPIWLSRR